MAGSITSTTNPAVTLSRLTVSFRPRLSALLILAADVVSLTIATCSSEIVQQFSSRRYELAAYGNLWQIVGLGLSVYALCGLYPGIAINPVAETRQASSATTLLYMLLVAAALISHDAATHSRFFFLMAWLFSLVLVPVMRALVRGRVSRWGWWGYPVIVFSAGETGKSAVRSLMQHPELGLKPVAVFDRDVPKRSALYGVPVIDGEHRAFLLAREQGILYGLIAMPSAPCADLLRVLESHANVFARLLIIPDLFGVSSLGIQTRDVARFLTLEIRKSLLLPGSRLMKRLMDLSLALVTGIIALPVIALIAILIKLESHGPVFYGHSRIGQGNETFKLWKFRSMCVDGDRVLERYLKKHPELIQEWQRFYKFKEDPRVTRVGRFLRKTSLDELPQLWNILKGDMSLVGPRPIVDGEVPKYGDRFALYTQVAPGLTGLWQVSGRNNTSYPERVELDTYYVRNWSPWLDIHVLAKTIGAVLRGEGAY